MTTLTPSDIKGVSSGHLPRFMAGVRGLHPIAIVAGLAYIAGKFSQRYA
jgi:hypothetical protein